MKPQFPILLLRPSCALHSSPPQHLSALALTQRRRFSNALTPLQTLTATRILAYPAKDIYNIIADIASYPQFIPYCTSSTITSLSSPDDGTHTPWPRTADLRISYGPYDEVYKSRVYCDPYRILEAVAGEAAPTIAPAHYHHNNNSTTDPAQTDSSSSSKEIFTSLLARWTFREFPYKPQPPNNQSPQEGDANANASHPRTEVHLLMEVRFASAVYSALSQAAAPKVAGMVVEAFERRAGEVLGQGHGPVGEATGWSGKAVGHA
ncbi:MAG: Coenzyme Q-binding protein coq10, mitochondrial [Ramalina farinacea]|uniref:Coenzyme Q-binding protein coq10, mitochondrial n=1 Tax=Ramalina farinacea TaxID=258253 RepID=A0AA43QR30_9LECA|nr:Coenzyme Q-binding protein coq10, mitochondrial [Ramalina farinacea]